MQPFESGYNKIPAHPDQISQIINPDKNESLNEVTTETFIFMRDMLSAQGYSEYTDINQAYNQLPDTSYIVRREDPKNILQLFSDSSSYEVGFPEDTRYSNCVEWNPATDGPRNISNAYLEGFTHLNSVVTVVGLEKTSEDDLVQLKDATQDFYGLDRTGVRSFAGPVTQDKVQFINLRIPGHLLPEQELTDDEIDKVDEYLEQKEAGEKASPVMIHRSFIKNESE